MPDRVCVRSRRDTDRSRTAHRRIDKAVRVNEQLVITAWRIGTDRRKQHSACVISSADGETLATSKAVWIALEEPSTFGAATKGPA